MQGLNLVAVYEDRATAEDARQKLLANGVRSENIRLSAEADAGRTTVSSSQRSTEGGGGLWDWLFAGDEVSDADRSWYGSNLGERTAVSVHVDEAQSDRVRDLLDQLDPVDIGLEPSSTMASGSAMGAAAPTSVPTSASQTGATTRPGEEQVIPIVDEKLEVGKRTRETRHRIRAYVVERPVEKDIPLRDERVVIERRPVTGDRAAMAQPGAMQEREFEVVERHEEPVVDKKAAATEEVVIRKDVDERVETVRDTVRETRIEDEGEEDSGIKR